MPHNFTGLDLKHNNFRKGFFIDPYDEPTYLTFALDFNFDSVPGPDPTAEANLFNSPLFAKKGDQSAITFLRNRGYQAQANGVATFTEILRFLTYKAPWYFQSIDGIGELYNRATKQEFGNKARDIELTVETLEAIDLRIFELAGLYRNSIFDTKFRRERVPDNLRWFSVDIYIAEFRNIRYRLPGVAQEAANVLGVDTGAIGNVVGGGNILSNVMNQFGYIKLSCRQCEFDFSQTFPTGRKAIEIGAEGRRAETNRFNIKVGWVEEEVKFGDGTKIFDDYRKTDIKNPWGTRNIGATVENVGSFLSGLPIIGEKIQDAGQKAADALSSVGGLVNPALQAASQFIEPPISEIGDIYDTGYDSNGDEAPQYPNPPANTIYDTGYESNNNNLPTFNAEPTGEAHSIGYQNPTGEVAGAGTPPNYQAEPTGDNYDIGYQNPTGEVAGAGTPPVYQDEPTENYYDTGDLPLPVGNPFDLGDVYDTGYDSNGDTPPNYQAEPTDDAYDTGYDSNGDTPPTYPDEPTGNVYP